MTPDQIKTEIDAVLAKLRAVQTEDQFLAGHISDAEKSLRKAAYYIANQSN